MCSMSNSAAAGIHRIPLTRGMEAVIDAEDLHLVSGFSWHFVPAPRTGYARGSRSLDGVREWVPMHRIIISAPDGVEVDHIDGDGLNNRRSNLRLCTHQENLRNRRTWGLSRFRGVGFKNDHWRKSKWYARIAVDGRAQCLGHFRTPEEAAIAYDEAAARLFGEFAKFNFPNRRLK